MTKLANPEIIELAKKELIERIKKGLDLKEIKRILEEYHNIEISGDLEPDRGDLVINDDKIAYKMEFEVLLSLSVLIDSNGNHISPEDTEEENIEEVGGSAEDIVQGM